MNEPQHTIDPTFTMTQIYGPWDFDNAVNASADADVRAKDMGSFYADVIRAHSVVTDTQEATVSIRRVNEAILKRWSPRTLNRIKNDGWAEVSDNTSKKEETT